MKLAIIFLLVSIFIIQAQNATKSSCPEFNKVTVDFPTFDDFNCVKIATLVARANDAIAWT